ncbi:MAG: TadE/TadG family type IV pilus assembly protein [Pseudomonadota bacterium]
MIARRFLKDRNGGATMEFMVLFPFLMTLIFMIAEIGTFMVRSVNIERALDIAIRDVRLGVAGIDSLDGLRTRICGSAFLISDCESALLVELFSLGNAAAGAGLPAGLYQCRNRAEDIDPVVSFDPSGPGEIIVVRACLVADPIFPATGLLSTLPEAMGGGYAILAQSAFINEPD